MHMEVKKIHTKNGRMCPWDTDAPYIVCIIKGYNSNYKCHIQLDLCIVVIIIVYKFQIISPR